MAYMDLLFILFPTANSPWVGLKSVGYIAILMPQKIRYAHMTKVVWYMKRYEVSCNIEL